MYATYRRIEALADVPPASPLDAAVRESSRLDFKKTVTPTTPWEHAKDLAAFANGFGGVILIGVAAADGAVTHNGIPRPLAAQLAEAYEQAAKDLCSPSPVIDAIIIPMATGDQVFLAVNVDPFVEGPVGARAGKQDRHGTSTTDPSAWLFPVRDASHTNFLRPNELPMYMIPKLRRSILLLDHVEMGEAVYLWHRAKPNKIIGDNPLILQSAPATKQSVDLARNSILFLLQIPTYDEIKKASGPPAEVPVRVPLTEVEDVWQEHSGRWNLRLGGRIEVADAGAFFIPVVR